MPDFYLGDLDISPDDFVYACTDNEIIRLVEILIEDGHIKPGLSSVNDSVLDELFNEALEKLAVSRHKLTSVEEEIIKTIASRL